MKAICLQLPEIGSIELGTFALEIETDTTVLNNEKVGDL